MGSVCRTRRTEPGRSHRERSEFEPLGSGSARVRRWEGGEAFPERWVDLTFDLTGGGEVDKSDVSSSSSFHLLLLPLVFSFSSAAVHPSAPPPALSVHPKWVSDQAFRHIILNPAWNRGIHITMCMEGRRSLFLHHGRRPVVLLP